MGRVFSYEEIIDGRVPEPEDFVKATEAFVAEVEQGVSEGIVDGGFIYGSVAIGATGRRSDLDAFIAVPGPSSRYRRESRAIIGRIKDATSGRVDSTYAKLPHSLE